MFRRSPISDQLIIIFTNCSKTNKVVVHISLQKYNFNCFASIFLRKSKKILCRSCFTNVAVDFLLR